MTAPDPDRLADAEYGAPAPRWKEKYAYLSQQYVWLSDEYDRRGREIVELTKKLDIQRRLSDDLARALTEVLEQIDNEPAAEHALGSMERYRKLVGLSYGCAYHRGMGVVPCTCPEEDS